MAEVSRRKFIQLSVLSTAVAAGLSGCKNEALWKEEATGQYGGASNKIYPYVDQPEDTVDGLPKYFATTCQMCAAGCGIYVRTLGGRANKIEGNPYHPVNAGKTCLRGQLALQHLYNPDRLMRPAARPGSGGGISECSWDEAMGRATTALAASVGRTAVIIDGETVARSPSKLRLISSVCTRLDAKLLEFSVVDDAPWRSAAEAVYGRNQLPDYRIDQADLVVSFGGNFLEAWPSPVYYGRLFGEFRQGARRRPGDHGEFIYIGPRLSMTASKADLWLPCSAGTEAIVALGVVHELGGDGIPPAAAAEISGLSTAQILDLAARIRGAAPRSVAIGGDGLFAAADVTGAFTAVESINVHARSEIVNFGTTPLPTKRISGGFRSLEQLAQQIDDGLIGAVVTIGPVNPAFALPTRAAWLSGAAKAPFMLSITSFLDETSSAADVVLAARSFLEEWSDQLPAVLPSGCRTASMAQPVIDPNYITKRNDLDEFGMPKQMMDTRETSDILIDLLNRLGSPQSAKDGLDVVRTGWSAIDSDRMGSTGDMNDDLSWLETISDGGKWSRTSSSPALLMTRLQMSISGWPPKGRERLERKVLPAPQLSAAPLEPGTFHLLLFPHIYYGDGRHANLGWAQEMPDPMSSAVWNSWVEINAAVAHELGIRTGDLVRLTSAQGSLDAAAIPTPGIHPQTVAVPMGQGHTMYGRNASGIGVNPLFVVSPIVDMSTGALAFSASTVTIAKVGDAVAGFHPELKTLVLVQDRPHGDEPAAVKGLIHETAAGWKAETAPAGAKPKPTYRSKPLL